jgi:hypothetical protein
MTTIVKKGKVRSARAERVHSKLAARSATPGRYTVVSTRRQAVETKLKKLREETRNSTVEVLTDA